MKKLIVVLILIVGFLLFLEQRRNFYCNPKDGSCITVWKRLGGKCYIIPGHYDAILKPDDNYIKTSNIASLTLFFTSKNTNLIVVDPGLSECTIINNSKKNVVIADYRLAKSSFDTVFFNKAFKLRNSSDTSIHFLPTTTTMDVNVRELIVHFR